MGERKRREAAAATLGAQVQAARSAHAAGRPHIAQDGYRRVLQADPQYAAAWLGLGLLARDTGHRAQALPFLAKAAECAPQDAPTQAHYALALQERDEFELACTHWQRACELAPDDATYWESLGIASQAAGDIERALPAYERAAALAPGAARRVKIATAISPIPASRAAIAAERERMATVLDELLAAPVATEPDALAARLWTNFYLAYHGANDRELQIKTATLYARICPTLGYVAPHCAAARPPRARKRIGLISNFLRRHSIGRTSRGFFAALPRERFEVHALFIAPPVDDDVSRAIRRDADASHVIPADLAQAQAAIAALELDVLFYQDIGMEPVSYFLSFARLAPLQCVSFGHPDTSGVPNVDWFVSNDLYEPAHAGSHYSERLFLLHGLGSLAYYERPRLAGAPKPRSAFGLPADAPLYLCPQNLFKVHPDMDDLIAAILRRDPRAVVALVDGRVRGWSQRLRRRWLETLPDVQARIVFVPRQNENDYLHLIAAADVMLDTVHFNGMNTSLEAFAVGTPVVTLPAAFQRGRHTQAMYRRMGLTDLIARDGAHYVEVAVRAANDRAWREGFCAALRERCGVLFEDPAVIAEFTRFFDSAG